MERIRPGMKYREWRMHIASMAMQGVLTADTQGVINQDMIVQYSLELADKLIEKLREEESGSGE